MTKHKFEKKKKTVKAHGRIIYFAHATGKLGNDLY